MSLYDFRSSAYMHVHSGVQYPRRRKSFYAARRIVAVSASSPPTHSTVSTQTESFSSPPTNQTTPTSISTPILTTPSPTSFGSPTESEKMITDLLWNEWKSECRVVSDNLSDIGLRECCKQYYDDNSRSYRAEIEKSTAMLQQKFAELEERSNVRDSCVIKNCVSVTKKGDELDNLVAFIQGNTSKKKKKKKK